MDVIRRIDDRNGVVGSNPNHARRHLGHRPLLSRCQRCFVGLRRRQRAGNAPRRIEHVGRIHRACPQAPEMIFEETIDRRRGRAPGEREPAELRATGPAVIQAGLGARPQRSRTILEQGPHDGLRAACEPNRIEDSGVRIEAIEPAVTANPEAAAHVGERVDRSAARALAPLRAWPPRAERFRRRIEAHESIRR
jgi:hypothetical protein